MNEICACTCIASNFEAFARVLVHSFRLVHPDVPFCVLVADRPHVRPDFGGLKVKLIYMHELEIPYLPAMLNRYERKELVVALKPSLLKHLLLSGHRSVMFLDPDMLVTATLEPVMTAVAEHSLTLTPHIGPSLLAGGASEKSERHFLMSGMYNAGFVGVSRQPESLGFLAWWERRLRNHCYESVERGISYDQRWLDLAPGFVADLHLLRDPGCNVAYWNLPILDIHISDQEIAVNGAPLRLFHFSGFNPSEPEVVTSYLPEQRTGQTGQSSVLFSRYAALVREAGWDECSARPWPWDGWRYWARWTARMARRLLRSARRLARGLWQLAARRVDRTTSKS